MGEEGLPMAGQGSAARAGAATEKIDAASREKAGGCPRVAKGFTDDDPGECPALACVSAEEGSGEHLAQCVEALLGCRAFLWDVLMDGGWTGCARSRLKELTGLYGSEAVGEAFDA